MQKNDAEKHDSIYIKGARVHNLKNISLEIPHNRLVVVTGLSGSGKSTLAFDTLFAEGQRRYVESLSAYARQFLGRIDKPDVDSISGIAPAIAIEQKVNTRNPRSTVGTSTEIYDYLKLLFARIGRTYSPVTGREVRCYQVQDIVSYIVGQTGRRVLVCATVRPAAGQGAVERLTLLVKEGIQRIYADGAAIPVEEYISRPGIEQTGEFDIVVDRVKVRDDEETKSRLGDSVAQALSYGGGSCKIVVQEEDGDRAEIFSTRFEADGMTFEVPTEHMFSFNNPIGACPVCEGYGKVVGIDEELVVPDKTRSIYDDAIAAWRGDTMKWWKEQLVASAHKFDFPIHRPYYELTREQKQLLWTGNRYFKGLNDFFAYLESERYKIQYRVLLSRY
ncbi:MAG: excinuclease ABC subunit A, partial [Alistipes inops]